MQNTCPKGSQTEGRQSAWQESVLCSGPPFCFWFFFIESTENFGYWWAVLEKKSHILGCLLVTDFMTISQSSDSGRSPVRWNARPRFFLTWMFASPIHNTYDFTLLKPKKPDLTLFTIETQPSFFLPSNTFLHRTHLSVFGVPPSRSARPQIHGNRGQWRNSHKPHLLQASFNHGQIRLAKLRSTVGWPPGSCAPQAKYAWSEQCERQTTS